jgi:hypothetical protein
MAREVRVCMGVLSGKLSWARVSLVNGGCVGSREVA